MRKPIKRNWYKPSYWEIEQIVLKNKIDNNISISDFWTLERIKIIVQNSKFCKEIYKREISGKNIQKKLNENLLTDRF